jgi:uncharacterized tellurite resistance protein B-like protein
MTTQPHEGLELSVDERIDYLATVASIAAVDVKLQNSEKAKLRELCVQLGIPDDRIREVLDVAERPTGSVERRLERLKNSDLRFVLLTACLRLAHVDGDYGAEEQAEIRRIADTLGVDGEQLDALTEAVAASIDGAPSVGVTAEQVATRLAAVGVPVAAVGAASALGLGVSGATSGAAAIGLGLTAATGFGLALGVGVGTFVGVRWLAKKLR